MVAVAAADTLRAVEVVGAVLVGLLVCPPLAILAFVFVVPFLVVALVVGLVVAILSTPYLLVHHFRGHHDGHLSLLASRLRHAARALIDLAPHRIVADVRTSALAGDRNGASADPSPAPGCHAPERTRAVGLRSPAPGRAHGRCPASRLIISPASQSSKVVGAIRAPGPGSSTSPAISTSNSPDDQVGTRRIEVPRAARVRRARSTRSCARDLQDPGSGPAVVRRDLGQHVRDVGGRHRLYEQGCHRRAAVLFRPSRDHLGEVMKLRRRQDAPRHRASLDSCSCARLPAAWRCPRISRGRRSSAVVMLHPGLPLGVEQIVGPLAEEPDYFVVIVALDCRRRAQRRRL